jgi:uncharacterized hydrophobic protein (TIGR00341 family)
MAYRLIVATIPMEKSTEKVNELLKRYEVLSMWRIDLPEGQLLLNILIRREKTEAIMNLLQKRFAGIEGFRVILVPVEASIPIPEAPVRILPEEDKEDEGKDGLILEELVDRLGSKELVDRLSRQEIYADISDLSRISNVYIIMMVLSSLVAAIGVLNNNVAVIIGAMVIAPLFGPNIALSLATVLGDGGLARDAIKTNFTGIGTALVISILLGLFATVDPSIPELLLRTKVGLGSVTLALASGIVGALAFTRGFRTALVGVMVAVALLPPLVTFGLLLGSGNFFLASGALLLFMVNLVCINLAGVLTFLIQRIRPIIPEKAERAKKMTNIALIIWIVLLLVFVNMILLRRGVFDVVHLG